jgi:hypothetical protein
MIFAYFLPPEEMWWRSLGDVCVFLILVWFVASSLMKKPPNDNTKK